MQEGDQPQAIEGVFDIRLSVPGGRAEAAGRKLKLTFDKVTDLVDIQDSRRADVLGRQQSRECRQTVAERDA